MRALVSVWQRLSDGVMRLVIDTLTVAQPLADALIWVCWGARVWLAKLHQLGDDESWVAHTPGTPAPMC